MIVITFVCVINSCRLVIYTHYFKSYMVFVLYILCLYNQWLTYDFLFVWPIVKNHPLSLFCAAARQQLSQQR